MAGIVRTRLKHAWNAFSNEDDRRHVQSYGDYGVYGSAYGSRPDRLRLSTTNERTIISSIYNKLSLDVADISIRHVRMDDQNRYLEDMPSGLNNCLTVEANIDQAAQAFRQDIALTLFDKGTAALVPVDTTLNPFITGGYDVQTLRVGDICAWFPRHVRVNVYNEKIGRREEITLPKSAVAVIENPFYSVMNEPNSTLQRLIRKLNLLDAVDEQAGSGKLDLIIQLPYVIKSEARRQQADQRRLDIENQLKGSKYGIAYTDGTEKITQLNRAAENNLWQEIKDLTDMLYTQLGLTPEIMNGTADEATMLNYYNRTVKPVLRAITEGMARTFLTKTARSQHQSVTFFRDPFQFTPVVDISEIADKFTRNEILSSNEIRQFIGIKPSTDPKAEELRNSNMPQPEPGGGADEAVNATVDEIGSSIDNIYKTLGVTEDEPPPA